MLKKSLRNWYLSWAGRTGADTDAPAVAAAQPAAYKPSPWFHRNWQLLGERRPQALELQAPDTPSARDHAELECLNAGISNLRGDLPAAAAHATTALAARPDFAHAYVERARALHSRGDYRAALADFERATQLVPDDAQTLTAQAHAHLALNERVEAFDCYQLAVAHAPDYAAARLGLARMLREGGDARAALEQIRHALRASPLDAELHFESALLHGRCNDLAGAIAAYEQGLRLEPGNFAACANCGLLYLTRVGDPLAAQRYFERALALDAGSVEVQANVGLALEEQGRVDEALAHYAKLIAAYPTVNEYRWNRGLALLATGDYAHGWDDYEMRNARGRGTAERAFPFPAWDGAQLRPGTALLVFAEQGLGDEIMFASCVPDLLARGIDCVVECDVRLASLFARSFPGSKVHGAPRDGDRRWLAGYPHIEAQCAIGSLPRWLRRSAADFPTHAGYLKADRERVQRWQTQLARLSPGPKIGVTWRGGGLSTRGDLRSISLSELAPILDIRGVTFVNLQRDGADALATAAVRATASTVNFPETLNDLEELAALMTVLDYVVTVDNTVAHLAGALGCSTSIMLSRSADWRWLRAQSASPWYPGVKLYRQAASRQWAGVVSEIAHDLKRLA